MLSLLTLLAWLGVVTIVLAACRLAARADATVTASPPSSAPDEGDRVLITPGLTVWDCAAPDRVRSVAAALSAPRPGLAAPAARRPEGDALRGARRRTLRRTGTRSPARS